MCGTLQHRSVIRQSRNGTTHSDQGMKHSVLPKLDQGITSIIGKFYLSNQGIAIRMEIYQESAVQLPNVGC